MLVVALVLVQLAVVAVALVALAVAVQVAQAVALATVVMERQMLVAAAAVVAMPTMVATVVQELSLFDTPDHRLGDKNAKHLKIHKCWWNKKLKALPKYSCW
jgi:hypothetical protein